MLLIRRIFQNPSAKAIVRACYLTLGGLAHKHAKNQERLWKNVKEPLLLAIGAGVAAEIALAEVRCGSWCPFTHG